MDDNRSIRIGVNPLSWMNSDFPHLNAAPVEQCLQEASEIGYEGVELENPFREVMSELPEMLHRAHLFLAAGWHSTYLLDKGVEYSLDALQKHLDLLKFLGAKVVNLGECSRSVHRKQGVPLSTRPILNEKEKDQLAEGLEKLAERTEEEGMISAYHPHMGTVVQTGEEVQALMERTSKLGLLLDTGHLFYAGADPLAVQENFQKRITHVHFKNIRKKILDKLIDQDSDFLSAVLQGAFTVPGDPEGSYDFAPVIDRLKKGGYTGWIIMEAEQDPSTADPYTYAEMGYKEIAKNL